MQNAVATHLALGGPRELSACDAIAEVAWPGYLVDWTIVKAVHAVAVERWSAIGYTEQTGFEVTPPDADSAGDSP